jgi:hypothetical protein
LLADRRAGGSRMDRRFGSVALAQHPVARRGLPGPSTRWGVGEPSSGERDRASSNGRRSEGVWRASTTTLSMAEVAR